MAQSDTTTNYQNGRTTTLADPLRYGWRRDLSKSDIWLAADWTGFALQNPGTLQRSLHVCETQEYLRRVCGVVVRGIWV